MNKEKDIIHFSIGKDFGKTIYEIATEKLICDYDLLEAIKVISDAFVGITNNLVLDILSGKKVLTVNVDTQDVNVDSHTDEFSDYEILDIDPWIRKEYHKTLALFDGLKNNFGLCRYELDKLDKSYFGIEFDTPEILSYIFAEDKEEDVLGIIERVKNKFKDNQTISSISDVIKVARSLSIKAIKLSKCIPLLNKNGLYTDNVRAKFYEKTLHNRVLSTNQIMLELRSGKMLHEHQKEMIELEAYLEGAEESAKEIKRGIQPKEDLLTHNLCDAYWISPEGETYGLNGHIANMLHYQMACAIINEEDVNEKLIERATGEQSADSLLGEKGWCKITNNWVLYDGYHYDKPLTRKQQQTIYTLGQRIMLEKGLALKLGLKQVMMSAAKFDMLDKHMLRKHLSLN